MTGKANVPIAVVANDVELQGPHAGNFDWLLPMADITRHDFVASVITRRLIANRN